MKTSSPSKVAEYNVLPSMHKITGSSLRILDTDTPFFILTAFSFFFHSAPPNFLTMSFFNGHLTIIKVLSHRLILALLLQKKKMGIVVIN